MVNSRITGNMPLPFPDENCYSLLCRYAVRRGLITTAQISEELFEYTEPLSGYLYKPFRMRNIRSWFGKDKIPWQYGKDHSCYPYYSLFVSSAHAEILRSCAPGTTMNSGTAKRINRDCGFTRSRKRALWYCPECVKQDFSLYGETCWRRLPQLPGAVYCPVHRVKLRESGVRVQDIQYQIVPATYALIHVPEPEPEAGNVYSERYIQLAEDMAWILANGFSLHGFDWIRANYYGATGRTIRQHLFYGITEREHRGNQFEDYLASKIMKDTAKERIDPFASRQLGTILSLEDKFGTVENFYNEHGEE